MDDAVDRLGQRLDAATKADLAKLSGSLPAWMRPVVDRITSGKTGP